MKPVMSKFREELIRIQKKSYRKNVKLVRDSLEHNPAVEAYEKAIRLAPENIQAHYNLAVTYWKLNKWPDVVRELRKVLSIDPEHRNAGKFLPVAIENMEKMKK